MTYLLNNGELCETKPAFQSRRLHLNPISHFTGDDKAQQSFKDECDINNIMHRFETTGQLPDLIKQNPQYGDFTEVPSYLDALNTVNLAETQFSALSSKVRAQFDNDPRQFLEFVNNPANQQEMVKMGLATEPLPTPPTPPVKVIITEPKASKKPDTSSLKGETKA